MQNPADTGRSLVFLRVDLTYTLREILGAEGHRSRFVVWRETFRNRLQHDFRRLSARSHDLQVFHVLQTRNPCMILFLNAAVRLRTSESTYVCPLLTTKMFLTICNG